MAITPRDFYSWTTDRVNNPWGAAPGHPSLRGYYNEYLANLGLDPSGNPLAGVDQSTISPWQPYIDRSTGEPVSGTMTGLMYNASTGEYAMKPVEGASMAGGQSGWGTPDASGMIPLGTNGAAIGAKATDLRNAAYKGGDPMSDFLGTYGPALVQAFGGNIVGAVGALGTAGTVAGDAFMPAAMGADGLGSVGAAGTGLAGDAYMPAQVGADVAGNVTPGVQSFTSPPVTPQVGGYSINVPSTDYFLGGQGPGYNPVSTDFGGAGVGAPTGMGLEATTAGGGALTTGISGAAGTTAVPGTIATAGAELGGLSGSTGVFDQFINYVSNLTPSSAAKDIKSASDLVKLGSSVVGIGSGINSIVNPGISPTDAQRMTDPFASSRQQYINQLNAVMANPSLTMSTPGYQFQLEQGLQGLNRNLAQRGMGTSVSGQPGTPASGGAGIAQQKYGQEYALSSYNNYVNRLAGLAGATQQPAQGGNAALTAQQAAQKQAQAGWGALGEGVGALSTYFGGGGTGGGTQTTGMTSPVGGYTDWQNTDMGSQDVPAYNLPNTSVGWTSGFDLMP